jgi:hypothetical protein
MVANFYADPSVLMPGHFDYYKLQPMYSKIYEKYKNNNPNNIMMFEPSQFPDTVSAFGGIINSIGFDTPPGGEIGSDKHVLNDHMYCCVMDTKVCETGQPTTDYASQC